MCANHTFRQALVCSIAAIGRRGVPPVESATASGLISKPVGVAVGSDVIARPERAALTGDLDVDHDGILQRALTVFTTSV